MLPLLHGKYVTSDQASLQYMHKQDRQEFIEVLMQVRLYALML